MNEQMYAWTQDGLSPREYITRRDEEKRSIKRQSIRAGLCVIAFLILDYAASFILVFSPLYTLYVQNETVKGLIEMGYYLLCMLVPFVVAFRTMRPEDRQMLTLFEKPVSKSAAVAAVFAGFLMCTAADYVTSVLVTILENAGFSVEGGVYDTPVTGVSLVYSLLTIGILPAFVEEFALRGVIMQPLRRHGDRFAIVMSACIFALMHGNLSQFSFAFIVGLAIGYFVVATGSVWVGVAIHMLNNTYSVVLNYLIEARPTAAEKMYNFELSFSLVFGILCFVLFLTVCRRNRLQKDPGVLTAGEKTAAYAFTLPMVIAVIALIVKTVQLIHWSGV